MVSGSFRVPGSFWAVWALEIELWELWGPGFQGLRSCWGLGFRV